MKIETDRVRETDGDERERERRSREGERDGSREIENRTGATGLWNRSVGRKPGEQPVCLIQGGVHTIRMLTGWSRWDVRTTVLS
jgi:hypothetical protein